VSRTLALVVTAALCGAIATSPVVADPAVPAAQRRAQIKKKIQSLRAAELTTDLDLDSQTAARLTATLNKFDDETDALVQQRVDTNRKLQNVGPNTPPRDADHLVDDATALNKAFRDLEDRRFAEVRKLLSPQQTAKLMIVLPEFERRIQNQLRNAIQNAGQGAKKKPRDDEDRDD
jgi:hypothetical protein